MTSNGRTTTHQQRQWQQPFPWLQLTAGTLRMLVEAEVHDIEPNKTNWKPTDMWLERQTNSKAHRKQSSAATMTANQGSSNNDNTDHDLTVTGVGAAKWWENYAQTLARESQMIVRLTEEKIGGLFHDQACRTATDRQIDRQLSARCYSPEAHQQNSKSESVWLLNKEIPDKQRAWQFSNQSKSAWNIWVTSSSPNARKVTWSDDHFFLFSFCLLASC